MPFRALRGWYPSLVQLLRDGIDGDKASFPKLSDCRGQRVSSHVRDRLECEVAANSTMCRCESAQAREHPPYGTAMPPAVAGTRQPSSIQLIRKTEIGSKARCHKLSNGGEQSTGAGVCGSLARSSSAYPSLAGRSFTTSLHRAIMAGLCHGD